MIWRVPPRFTPRLRWSENPVMINYTWHILLVALVGARRNSHDVKGPVVIEIWADSKTGIRLVRRATRFADSTVSASCAAEMDDGYRPRR
jgi:hypothetical protein